jgi:hypothetical protein
LSFLFLVLTDQSDYSAYGDDGTTMELSARAADDEASVRRWHVGEEGMEARGLGNVYFALVPWAMPRCGLALPHFLLYLQLLIIARAGLSCWWA